MSEALLIKLRPIVLWFTALSFITVGVMHFTHEYIFLPMMPEFLPYHLELVWLSGVFEILGGLGILVPQTRRFSAWGLLALLVAVFPANINMALNGIVIDVNVPQSDIGRWLRLPFQFVFAAQIYYIGLWRPKSEATRLASPAAEAA